MSAFLDEIYIDRLAPRLRGYKELRRGVINFSCPLCGDSLNTSKKRGYLLKHETGEWSYFCHNCGASMPFWLFLKNMDCDLYKQYNLERFKNQKEMEREEQRKERNRINDIFKSIPSVPVNKPVYTKRVIDLPEGHPAKEYIKGRQIPYQSVPFVKWTDDFKGLINDTMPGKYEINKLPDSGIVFELKNLEGEITGYQIRSIDPFVPKSRRFVTCSINEKHDWFYTNFDINKTHYIIEGCSDVLCTFNSCAVLSASLYRLHFNDNSVYVNDCEPRNKEVCSQIENCIRLGYKTVLLPPDKFDGMDMNDIIKSGVSYEKLPELLNRYTFSGLRAKMEFSKWKR